MRHFIWSIGVRIERFGDAIREIGWRVQTYPYRAKIPFGPMPPLHERMQISPELRERVLKILTEKNDILDGIQGS